MPSLSRIILSSLMAAAAAAASGEIPIPRDPACFFIQPDAAAVLEWSGTTSASQARISNYEGKEVTNTPLSREDGRISTSVRLPRGYYEIDLEGRIFGIVSLEPFVGARDPFFGIDAVLTWLDKRHASRLAMVKSLDRCGVALARERLNWNALEPKPGEWNWKADQTLSLREIYAQARMPVLEMFHSAGPAKNAGQFPFRTLYPQDLSQVVTSWPEIHRTLQGTWAGLEVWNEPEGSAYGSRLPADQYTVLVKAMRYAWDKNQITSPLGGGVFMGGDPGFFHDFCIRNGLLDAVNFISIHDYKPAAAMERLMTMYRDWLQRNGKEGMPLWITESGWAWPKGGPRPSLQPDAKSALQIAMKGVEAKACGVARYMPFCLAFYEEGGIKSFSMLGREVTPLRSMAAYAQSIRVLAGKTYVGDLPGNLGLARARVFRGGGETVAVLYSEGGKKSLVGFPGTPKRIEGIDGRSVKPLPDGSLPLSDGLLYVWSDDLLPVAETPAMQLLRASRLPVPGPLPASPILLQYIPDPGTVTHASTRYLTKPSDTGLLTVTVRIHNLSQEAKTISLRVHYPTAQEAEGSRQSAEIPARSTADFSWKISPSEHWKVPDPQPLTVTAADAGEERGRAYNLHVPDQVAYAGWVAHGKIGGYPGVCGRCG